MVAINDYTELLLDSQRH